MEVIIIIGVLFFMAWAMFKIGDSSLDDLLSDTFGQEEERNDEPRL
jgi:hypothetical protein